MPPTLCVLVQLYYCLSSLPLSLPILSLSFLLGYTPVSGFVIGLCPIIFDNEDGFCLFDWVVTERESSQFSCLVSAKLAAALTVLPFSPDHVFLVQFFPPLCISPALVSLPIKRFLSPASLFGYAPASGFMIGLCPINSDHNGSLCLFDWIVPECGSSEFSQAASANLAVLS